MDEPMNFALVGGDGIVNNVIWLCASNRGDFPNAVCVADRPVAIGDLYAGGGGGGGGSYNLGATAALVS